VGRPSLRPSAVGGQRNGSEGRRNAALRSSYNAPLLDVRLDSPVRAPWQRTTRSSMRAATALPAIVRPG
jgi:hypothetical protein